MSIDAKINRAERALDVVRKGRRCRQCSTWPHYVAPVGPWMPPLHDGLESCTLMPTLKACDVCGFKQTGVAVCFVRERADTDMQTYKGGNSDD